MNGPEDITLFNIRARGADMSPLLHGHKILAPRQQIPHGTDKNYFQALEIYFRSFEIYFSAFEIYFRATEKVLLRAPGNFVICSRELYGSHLRFSWLVPG